VSAGTTNRGCFTLRRYWREWQSTDERRTVHLEWIFLEPGAAVNAPLEGVVHVVANNSAPLDYGPVVILRHEAGGAMNSSRSTGISPKRRSAASKWTAHRSRPTIRAYRLFAGKRWLDAASPFQIILDLLELGADFPGVAYASQRGVWTSLRRTRVCCSEFLLTAFLLKNLLSARPLRRAVPYWGRV